MSAKSAGSDSIGPMKKKKFGGSSKAFREFESFVKRLLVVPKEELQKKLDEEKSRKTLRRK